jgi:hypothetical protein
MTVSEGPAGSEVTGTVLPPAVLSGSGGRYLYNPSTVAGQLTEYKVTLGAKEFTILAGGSLSAKAPPGKYTITVRGMALPSTISYTTFGTGPML